MSKKIQQLLRLRGILVFSGVLLAGTFLTATSQGYVTKPWGFDNGGGKSVSANYTTLASIGQVEVGQVRSSNYQNEAGYLGMQEEKTLWYSYPMFKHDPQRTGHPKASGVFTSNSTFIWNFDTNSPVGPTEATCSPITDDDGTVYWGTMDNTNPGLYAIDATDGTQDWFFPTGLYGKISSTPAFTPLYDGRIYVATHRSNGQANFFAIDRNGNQCWNLILPGNDCVLGSSLVVVEESSQPVIYFGSWNGTIYKIIDSNTSGSIQWSTPLSPYVPILSSPAIGHDGRIYIGAGVPGKLWAINPTNGSVIWSIQVVTTSIERVLSSPSVRVLQTGTQRIYIGTTDYRMCAVDDLGNSGVIRWVYTATGEIVSCPSIYDLNGREGPEIIFGSADGRVYAVTDFGNTCGLWWSYTTNGSIVSSPAVTLAPQPTVFIGSDDNKIYSIKWDGSLISSYITTGAVRASPSVDQQITGLLGSPGMVFCGSNDGKLYAFKHQGSEPSPELRWIILNSGINTGKVNVTICGTNFKSGLQIKLSQTNLPDIMATNVTVKSPNTITCTFDLKGAKPGIKDVIVINPDSTSGILESGFYIVDTAGWIIPISATIATTIGSATCGLMKDAGDGFDISYEKPIPPEPIDAKYIQIYFPHPEWNMSIDKFINDIRKLASKEIITWDFELKTNIMNTNLPLLVNILQVPIEYKKIILRDVEENISWDLRTTQMPININSGSGLKRFELMLTITPAILENKFKPGWNMISVPLQPINPTPEGIFGDDVDMYYVYEWDSGNYKAVDKKQGEIIPAKGYWLGLTGTSTIDVQGIPIKGQSTISVKAGWNIIGSPGTSTITLKNQKVEYMGSVKSFTDAVKAGWVLDTLYKWEDNAYKPTTGIMPWQGCWFAALKDCKLLVLPDVSKAKGIDMKEETPISPTSVISQDNWQIGLKVNTSNAEDTANINPVFGIAAEATLGLDTYDKVEPPKPPQGEYITLYFTHPEGEIFDKFDWDIRPSVEMNKSIRWNFNIETNISGDVSINWDKNQLPQGWTFILVDGANKVDMRVCSEYSYLVDTPKFEIRDSRFEIRNSTSPTNIQQFQIIVTKIEMMQIDAPAANLNAVYCYPNPAKEIATFAKLTSPAKIKLFNLAGELVKTLENNDNNDWVDWNLTNDDGSKVASGVYIYLITNDKSEKRTGKVAVIR